MVFFETWNYPEDSDKLSKILLQDEKKRVVVGVIGKSPPSNCNKMIGLNVVNSQISVYPELKCREGQIRVYYGTSDVIYLHFETTYDECCLRDAIINEMTKTEPSRNLIINKFVRNRFARMLLFATQVCHIIVYVELSVNFDPSLIPILKSLNILREKHLKFLSKLLKNPNSNSYPSKSVRNGSPRCLFYFENFPDGYDKSEESISKLEFEIEDNIYRLFRNELAFSNKSGMPLLTLPGNKRFVYFNTSKKKKDNLLPKSLNDLQHEFNKIIAKDNSVIRNCLEDLRPFADFGKPLGQNDAMPLRVDEKRITFDGFLKDHITEALQVGFDDCALRFKGKHTNKISSIRTWYDNFKQMYKILIEDPDDPDFKPVDSGYKSYLENFEKLMDMDEGFYSKCCEIGIKRASNIYSEPVLNHYGKSFQKGLVDDALAVYLNYARGPNVLKNEQKLIKSYEKIFNNEKQCNETSKVQPNASQKEKKHRRDNLNGYSKNVFASTCNCERAQKGREDLYTVRQENYEFIKTLQSSCIFCVNYNKVNVDI